MAITIRYPAFFCTQKFEPRITRISRIGEHRRLACGWRRLAGMNFSKQGQDCFGETPKPTPETGVLPGN
jgi:hypothetical protein